MSVESEHEAILSGAALWVRAGWNCYRWTGEKRVEFLHKYCTQEVRREPGQGAYGCVLTVKGGLKGDLWVYLREEDLLVVSAPAAQEGLYKHLSRYARFDRVVMEDLAETTTLLSVWGPQARAALATLSPSLPEAQHDHLSLSFAEAELTIARNDWVGVEGYDLFVPTAALDAVRAALEGAGAVTISDAAAHLARVEAGVPLFGVDMHEKTIPIEAGLEESAVNYDKGCYTGQEVIVRIKHRGKINRLLRGLRLPDGAQATTSEGAPQPLFVGEKQVSTLTSASVSPRAGALGLAIVHRKYEPGSTVHLGAPDGVEAQLVELPFDLAGA